MKKVSIIIPAYNVEKYLEQCIESAISQTMQDIEIICINDGSTDGSTEIMKEMAIKDHRIRLIDKPNSGYGSTMNLGIDLAEGKYIVFLESDDLLLPGACETLFEICEKEHLEIIKTDHYEFKTGKEDGRIYKKYMKASWEDDPDHYHKVLSPKNDPILFHYAMYTWSCMYDREFLNKYKIRHNETPGASYQDNGFWFQTLMYCERMYVLDQAFYMYRQDNPDSSIHSKEKINAFSDEYLFIRKKIEEYDLDDEKKQMLFRICAYFDLKLNMISLKRVDKKYTKELIGLITKKFEEYKINEYLHVKEFDIDFIKKLMICLAEPDRLKNKIWEYIEKDLARKRILEKNDLFILYGAGNYARRLLDSLEDCKLWNKKFLCGVTSVEHPGEKIRGIEIVQIDTLLKYMDKALVILCAKNGTRNYEEMCFNLKKWKVKNVIHSNEIIVDDLWGL